MSTASVVQNSEFSAVVRWGAVFAFLTLYIVSYIDRQAMSIVVDPLKASLGVSDTQIGLLQGFLFTTVLMVAAVPMSYLIDRFNRMKVLFICLALWSLTTALSGFATDFYELAACRIGLAIAEAVVPMAAMSVIGDLFPRERVGRAAAVFMNGSYFGNGVAMLLCGWLLAVMRPFEGQILPVIGSFEAWRGMFMALGAFSLIVAIGMHLSVKEPPRRELSPAVARSQVGNEFSAFFWSNRRLILSYCCFAGFISLIGYSLYAWTATVLIRLHHVTAPEAGTIMGPLFLFTSVPGTFISAWLGSRCRPEEALQHLIKVMTLIVAVLVPCFAAIPFIGKSALIGDIGLILLIYAALHASLLVPIQLISPNRMRGRLAAVTSMIWAIPAGNGPVIVGWLTDRIYQDPLAIGKSMAVTLVIAALSATAFGVLCWVQARKSEDDAMNI